MAEYTIINTTKHAETDRAILLGPSHSKAQWFPKSQVAAIGSSYRIPNWLMEQRGWKVDSVGRLYTQARQG